MLQLLIDSGADVNAVSKCENTPLRGSVKCGQIEKVKFLLERGADATLVREMGYTPLIKSPPPSSELIDLLVRAGTDPSMRSTYGESILTIASQYLDWKTVRHLKELGVDLSPLWWNGLMKAVVLGNLDDIKLNLEPGAINETDHRSRTAWLLAVSTGDVKKAAMLILHDAVLTDRGHVGETALHYGVQSKSLEMVKLLLQIGADPNAISDFGRTALMSAVEGDWVDGARELLKNGASVDLEDRTGQKAINFATSAEMVNLLIAAGADINYKSGLDFLLASAAEAGNQGFLKELLDRGAQPNLEHAGQTALTTAVQNDNLECMQILIAAGADVDIEDFDGRGLLFYVHSLEATKILLKNWLDLNNIDENGKLPYEFHADEPEIAELIRPQGVRRLSHLID
jgi:ankyrin repeat protein